jgi:hypothetical protein
MLKWVDFPTNYLSGELLSLVFNRLPRLQYPYLSYNNLPSTQNPDSFAP